MRMRRFTRLTNGFSEKVGNNAFTVALPMVYYNFVRIRSKLRKRTAMAGGVSDRLWVVTDKFEPFEDAAPAPKKM